MSFKTFNMLMWSTVLALKVMVSIEFVEAVGVEDMVADEYWREEKFRSY